jgi:hypothetical protein
MSSTLIDLIVLPFEVNGITPSKSSSKSVAFGKKRPFSSKEISFGKDIYLVRIISGSNVMFL